MLECLRVKFPSSELINIDVREPKEKFHDEFLNVNLMTEDSINSIYNLKPEMIFHLAAQSRVNPAEKDPDFTLALLGDNWLDDTFLISKVRFEEGSLGKYAIILVEGAEYRTSSEVLVTQLEAIKEYLNVEKQAVEVTLRKVKNYFTFE